MDDMDVDPQPQARPQVASLFSQMQKRKKGKMSQAQPWVEKYRPRSVSDVVYQDEVVAVLKRCVSGSDFPNLLFYGSPGTGKTSAILAAAREMFGSFVKERVLELNSSDERGIDVVREKVKSFSAQKVAGRLPDGTKCPAIRIVILDEADSMTVAAQSALRRVIESSTTNTRFCLICNYVTRIIEPIASRCSKFRFKPLTKDLVQKRLEEISAAENLTLEPDAMAEVIRLSDGDLRKAITLLHSVFRLKAQPDPADGVKKAHVCLSDVYQVSGFILPSDMEPLIAATRGTDLVKLMRAVTDLLAEGYAASQFMDQFLTHVLGLEDLTNEEKVLIVKKIASADHQLTEGGNQVLQVLSVCSLLQILLQHPDLETLVTDYRVD